FVLPRIGSLGRSLLFHEYGLLPRILHPGPAGFSRSLSGAGADRLVVSVWPFLIALLPQRSELESSQPRVGSISTRSASIRHQRQTRNTNQLTDSQKQCLKFDGWLCIMGQQVVAYT